MNRAIYLVGSFAISFSTATSRFQIKDAQARAGDFASLCVLQKQVAQGTLKAVVVSGVYGPGLDHTILKDPSCSEEETWVELDLKSRRNEDKLRRILVHSRRAHVVAQGDFYGPPLPDSKLPDSLKRNYHPGWGHLAAFKTKLVVHEIRDVKGIQAVE